MQIGTWRRDDGGVNIGFLVDIGTLYCVPVIQFKTWQEYTEFMTANCAFIEIEYEKEENAASIKSFVNSLESIDTLSK